MNLHHLPELFSAFPNFAATVFGFFGILITGAFGYLLKRPLEKQAAANDLFRAQVEGFEALIKSQAARILYLESQESIRVEYEAELVRQLRLAQLGHPFTRPDAPEGCC